VRCFRISLRLDASHTPTPNRSRGPISRPTLSVRIGLNAPPSSRLEPKTFN
jgi:hypothetical protein